MTFIVFDTETTGLPKNFKLSASEKNISNWNSCRLVQIAWNLYSDDNSLIHKICRIVKPQGFVIPRESTAIHNITHDYASENGEDLEDVINNFIMDLRICDTLVAHNIDFDINVIKSELIRLNKPTYDIDNVLTYCTMKNNTVRGGRYPKLSALYTRLIGPIDSRTILHDAQADCDLCSEIYINNISQK